MASWTRNEGTDSAVLWHGAVNGVGQWSGLGRCFGVGWCTGVGVEEEERGARNGGVGGGGRVRGERWCPLAWGGAPTARGEGLAQG